MLEIINEQEWCGFKQQYVKIKGSGDSEVTCYITFPTTAIHPAPVILATHGATSSKHEWVEFDGYTKGGNLSKTLLEYGIAIIAMDWHYHGDNDTAELNGRNVFENDEYFSDFFSRSVEDAKSVLTFIKNNEMFDNDRIGFSGYSLAGMFGFWLAGRVINFKCMVVCVPGVKKNEDKYYSTHKNVDKVKNAAILQVSAENDEYINFDDSKWLFEQIPVTTKKFISFKSGHSLPIDYVETAADWFKIHL